ncbi:AgmX/PglI C-terminal domain-containing protein [Lujinxingia vulgaris]|uniref:AgmX/PglI C-terminal domain-containing protein n=1 Tax=Lujinxingia vulgaris TaxID=2600176 RepID=A0A5C6XHK4_9DELT|nr:AgmX/PglI C-terminal domain-containing protein [Lujinxingia vulgaris]TXD38325.1 AgmX/PglI C-terminal domain-containing protein [Lujinxingia vulgaris]
MMLQAEIIQAGQVVSTVKLEQDNVKVGKLSSSHIRLDDDRVSRIHAVLERQPDGSFVAIDLGSASGTYVNGEKITKAAVGAGDELQFGDTVVRLSEVVEVAASPAAAFAATGELPEGYIRLEDGSVVQPYTMEGYYDDAGNYIPGYYDDEGTYHYGYGYHDDQGAWQVAHGFYDPQGEWVATPDPAGVQGPSDTELYTERFFDPVGGQTLEVAFLWSDHVLAVNAYEDPRSVIIGPDETNDFVVEDPLVNQPKFPLVSYSEGGGYRVNVSAQMEGLIQHEGQQFTLAEAISRGLATGSSEVAGGYSIALGPRTSIRVEFGSNTFLIHFTTMPALGGGMMAIDRQPIPYHAASAMLHILFLVMVFSWPEGHGAFELHEFQAQDRFVELLAPPEQEELEEEVPDWLEGGADTEEAAAQKGDEGEAGDEMAEEADNHLAVQGPETNDEIELRKARDTEIAMNTGALAAFNDASLSSMWGSGDTSVGSDAMHALGNMTGSQAGAAAGVGGLGLAGAGRGGGGVSERGIGMAQVGTAGRGGGGKGGGNYGKGGANLGDREVRQPKIVPGRPAVQGSLDREIIQRVVRQHRREMQHCYEQELQRNPNLAGRITVRWVISPTGSVTIASIAETSMNNSAVEQCMTQRIRRWVFPEPKGGGIVNVNYPFNFSS